MNLLLTHQYGAGLVELRSYSNVNANYHLLRLSKYLLNTCNRLAFLTQRFRIYLQASFEVTIVSIVQLEGHPFSSPESSITGRLRSYRHQSAC
jgi:hypothetical protein